ncbi:MAG: threonine--tRNA ligase [Patescibacteria group bacterium]|nr:threonine--tRNA ligase [Patescibacteria group bacterium]MDE2116452.1 threonine--tRNA ligase [Patescibacteria group bacterium]
MTSSIEQIRHSFAHLLAAAIGELYPGAKNTIGPAIENGFYYDFEFPAGKDGKSAAPSDKDFVAIEKAMRKILADWQKKSVKFEETVASPAEAKKRFADNPYKLELIDDIIKKGEEVTLYQSGDFIDLCRGGHADVADMKADAFKIDRVAGAYWRGDEKNTMLTRIYGLAFSSKAELEAYEKQIEEAKKRDHKKLGRELGLFVFSDLVGAGLPLWTPKGTMIRNLLDEYVWSMRREHGYERVTIPHITKKALYETSGHWKKYADDLFKIKSREGHEYALKPMNCPHHTQIFASEPRSYRDMPQRYCETTAVYRDEQSGELSGLSRVLGFSQDDAHVFCRENQLEQEIFIIWDIIDRFYKTFGFDDIQVRFSRHDPTQIEKYLGTEDVWKKAESAIRSLLEKRGVAAIDGLGEAAFYGPKIDFIARDSLGRTLQVATIQLDFNMPERFGLECTNEKGLKEQIVMIHCAIMGSIERFMATLLEHTGGNLPLWLAPIQVKIAPVRESNHERARELGTLLAQAGLRVDADTSDTGFGKKVREAKDQKIPYTIVIGDKDMEKGVVTLESRDRGKIGEMKAEDVVDMLVKEVEDKK